MDRKAANIPTTPAPSSKPPAGRIARQGSKAKTKAPPPVEDVLKRHFKSLVSQIDGGHFKNAIKTTDKIIRLRPDDKDALQAKLFLLLQTENYTEAMKLIDADLATIGTGHKYEKAYCLYRLNKEDEASSLLAELRDDPDTDQRGPMHLEAQISYRKENFADAVDLYTQLLDSTPSGSEEHNDTLTNLTAAQSYVDFLNTGFQSSLHTVPIDALESSAPPLTSTSITASTSAAQALANANTKIEAQTQAQGETKKKVRLRRVPKGVVPGVTPPPDPERWLKKSERSTFVVGKRRKGHGGGGGYGAGATQGSAVEKEPLASSGAGKGGSAGGGGKGKKRR